MITEKTKNLFEFIDYLHTNIKSFKQYDDIIFQLQNLDEQRRNLRPRENFNDKLKFDKIQNELNPKFDIIHKNITLPLYKKATELELGYSNNQKFWQWGLSEIYNLKEDCEEQDIPEILLNKNKYIEFRESTKCNYFNDMFFNDLDRDLKELFEFFKETTENEFDKFETKPLKVNDMFEVINLLNDGHKAFEIPSFILNKTKEQTTISYINESDKDQIFNKLVFNKGLYYFSDIHKNYIQTRYRDLEKNFQTEIDFEKVVNSLLHSNGLHFYSKLRTISSETEFIKYIQSQYNYYNEYTPDNSLKWLNFTKKAIMYGFGILRIENEGLKASFLNWYNETIQKIKTQQPKETENNNIHFNEFSDFLNYYKVEALAVNLSKENINVYDLLQTQQNKFKTADLTSEIDEVREHSKKAMTQCKESLNVAFINNHYKGKLIGRTPDYLVRYKLYLEYKELYEKTISNNNLEPQQVENSNTDEVKKELHNHIFKGNAFEVWQYMFDEFGINESSRTDVKFMFEEMRKKGEGLIHNTVNQTTFLEWIASTYKDLIIQKTSNHSRTKVRLQAYSRAKELYKK